MAEYHTPGQPGPPGPQGPPGPSGGTQINYWYHDDPSDIPTYSEILTAPANGAESDDSVSVVAADGEKLIEAYVTDPGVPGVTTIPAGNWTFFDYVFASSSVPGTTQLITRVYKRTSPGGVETELFNIATANLTNSTVAAVSINFASAAVVLAPSDRIVVKKFAKTTAPTARIVHFVHDGTLHASWFSTPSVLPMSTVAPVNVTKAPAQIGTSNDKAQADHKHDVDTATPVAIAFANAEGNSTSLARANHVHDGTAVANQAVMTITNLLGQWRTILQTDFSAQPNATYNSDGPIVLGGQPWAVEGHGNVYPGYTMQNVNGLGLRQVRPNSASPITDGSAPRYSWLLSGLPSPRTPIRAAIRIVGSAGWDNYAGVVLGIEYPSSVVGYRSGCFVSRVATKTDQLNPTCSNAGCRITRGQTINPAADGQIDYTPGADYPSEDSDTIGLWLPNGVDHVCSMRYLRANSGDGAMANMDLMRTINEITTATPHVGTKPTILANDILTPWKICLYGIGTNSNMDQSVYVAEIKVQAFY